MRGRERERARERERDSEREKETERGRLAQECVILVLLLFTPTSLLMSDVPL